MAVNTAFNPAYGAGKVETTGSSSASLEIGKGSHSFCITNIGVNPAFFYVGNAPVVADEGGFLIIPGQQKTVTKDPDANYISHIEYPGSGPTDLHIIPGEGI